MVLLMCVVWIPLNSIKKFSGQGMKFTCSFLWLSWAPCHAYPLKATKNQAVANPSHAEGLAIGGNTSIRGSGLKRPGNALWTACISGDASISTVLLCKEESGRAGDVATKMVALRQCTAPVEAVHCTWTDSPIPLAMV